MICTTRTPAELPSSLYYRWQEREDALRLGWLLVAEPHMPHGAYSCLVEWLCDFEPLWPAPRPD